MSGQRRRFGSDALHQIAVAHDPIGVMIDDVEAVAIEARRQMRFRHRDSDAVGETLAERAGGHFDAGRMAALRVARRGASPLPKLLDLFERDVVAAYVEEAV